MNEGVVSSFLPDDNFMGLRASSRRLLGMRNALAGLNTRSALVGPKLNQMQKSEIMEPKFAGRAAPSAPAAHRILMGLS
jgi:hypothetical protein